VVAGGWLVEQQLASMGRDTSADNESVSGGESVAPIPYVLGDASGPLDRGEL
jgi:xylulose-5-phosphate/fructose-6-phosphate phosphoketolase